jgi:hypothetical protein
MPTTNPRRKRATDNPDHARRTHVPAPADCAIEQRLFALVQPAVFAELAHYRSLGMRNRLLTLPVMVALVLVLIWRRVGGVCTLTRMLAHERLLWVQPTRVSQPARSDRFLEFPAQLFEGVLYRVLDDLPARAAARTRPLPAPLTSLVKHFPTCYALDGTTLEALFRKLHSLQEAPDAPLGGHVLAAVDLVTHLPVKLVFAEDSQTNDKALLPDFLAWLPKGSLTVFDLGFFSFPCFDALAKGERFFVSRLREKTSYTVRQTLVNRPLVRDQIVRLGLYRSNPCHTLVRRIEVYVNGSWRRYVTNVLDPQQLSIVEAVSLYDRRWSIETCFLHIKRLLELSYLWVGGLNGIQLQVWAPFLFYAVLIDLCDDVANELNKPLEAVSVEMVYRGLYFYVQAVSQGYDGSAATYFARQAKDLGILKRKRPPKEMPIVDQIRRALLAAPLTSGP